MARTKGGKRIPWGKARSMEDGRGGTAKHTESESWELDYLSDRVQSEVPENEDTKEEEGGAGNEGI